MFHLDTIILVLVVLMFGTVAVYKACTGWDHPTTETQHSN